MEEFVDEKEQVTKFLRKLAITKQLNFLIGSGASTPAIPLMSQCSDNDELVKKIQKVSKELLNDTYKFDNNVGKNYNNDIKNVLASYKKLIYAISDVLDRSNSRETPKEANLFTTNYDLFVEKAVDMVLKEIPLVFNDGARGYFNKYLDSSNFNRMVAYKGLNNNYIDELPSLTLIKPHGSVNWERSNDGQVIIRNKVVKNPMVVPPTGLEGQETFLNNHFHDMLRVFQLELDKPESVLFVLGFSFQDDHIARMIRRALENRRLIIECFCWSDSDKEQYLNNLKYEGQPPHNLKFITPAQLKKEHLYLGDLGKILLGEFE
ncbi:hypothetical protein GYW21_05745 [Lactobacillus mellis]|nr:hypothetical protein [Bombilactobacillus mellis]